MASSKYETLNLVGAYNVKQSLKTCTLTFHDEARSEHEVLLNEALFHNWKLKNGTPLRLSAGAANSRRGSILDLDRRQRRRGSTRQGEITLVFTYQQLSADVLDKYPNLEISVSQNIATSMNLVNRSLVLISQVDEDDVQASHVEIVFRDAYLTRADMWRLICSELAGKALYKGQKINFLNSIKAQIKTIYHHGEKLTSAFFAPSTKPIFRSESARYVIFLQMSKEMWDFEPEGSGEIMFNKVIDGFLPELFARWSSKGARHLISIVLFTRMEYPAKHRTFADHLKDKMENTLPYRDFYRVLISDMESGQHEAVLLQLKKDFKTFLRDISIRPGTNHEALSLFTDSMSRPENNPIAIIQGYPAPATRGNILEAINTASSQFSEDYIDRDLLRTGLSIVIVTPGTGVFEVEADLLNLTTDSLIENGVGIDLVCLARMPLHSTPLFKYRKSKQDQIPTLPSRPDPSLGRASIISTGNTFRQSPHFVIPRSSRSEHSEPLQDLTEIWNYAIPHWLDISFWTPKSAVLIHKNIGIRNFAPSKVKPFLTRVKMYEIQMMGIMENDTNSVSIPYLEPYHKFTTGNVDQVKTNTLRSHPSNASIRSKIHMSASYGSRGSEQLSVSPSPKSPSDISGASKLSNLMRWMEDHDEKAFETHESPISVTKYVERSLLETSQTLDSEIALSRPGSIRREPPPQSNLSKKPSLLGSSSSKSSKSVVTRETSSSNRLKPSVNVLGSLKGSRSNRVGFMRLGTLGAKATASIELSSETAHRESSLTHAMKSLSTTGILTTSETTPSNTSRDGTPRISIDEGRLPSRPVSPVSKPIVIRQPSRDKRLIQEQHSLTFEFEDPLTPRGASQILNPSEINLMEVPRERSTLMRTLAPWFTMLNPSNPNLTVADPSSRLGRWHHVFPRPLHASTIKWRSLCAPASIPLTTEGFPSAEQLQSEYETTTWSVSQSRTSLIEENDQPDVWLLRELVSSRFSNGYQVVVGNHIAEVLGDHMLRDFNIFNDEQIFRIKSPIYMSRGIQIHRLTLQDTNIVEVKQFIRTRGHGIADHLRRTRNLVYTPYVKTSLGLGYENREITISTLRETYDWKRFDAFISSHEQELESDIPDELRCWRARYVLIPMQSFSSQKKFPSTSPEDNEEEKRLEGLYKLIHLWQKHRHMPHQRIVARASADHNPLDIIFRTMPLSAIVESEFQDSLPERGSGKSQSRNLLPESELLNRSAVDIRALAQLLQGAKGIEMINRRWHSRQHDYSFVGIEFVTWLVDNFKDIDDREIAVEFGEQLMKEGLFSHVERRHKFRDGNFFYVINSEYRQPRVDKSTARYPFGSVPSTTIVETKNSPRIRPQTSDVAFEIEDGTSTPSEKPPSTKVVLSKKLVYDVDRKRKSYRKEIIHLHYDRVSSADDCYHLRIDWLNTTPKLIEDTVSSWASAVERDGLRLVEVPISEASRINDLHTFRGPYIVKLAKQPPDSTPRVIQEVSTSGTKSSTIRLPYHKALLQKFNFVLDIEAAKDFPDSVDVSYSWGKPDYHHPQFITRDGVLLGQIMDDGNILLLANRLANNRRGTQAATYLRAPPTNYPDISIHDSQPTQKRYAYHPSVYTKPSSLNMSSPRPSPFASPMLRATPDVALGLATRTDMITPLRHASLLESFCSDVGKLDRFYEEVRTEWARVSTGSNTPDLGPIEEGVIASNAVLVLGMLGGKK